mmetsp:Transcript_77879/g.216370  ORF Transcript_77879/g.216370 Transcript_77879/m.216370 type:complete len:211 (-) Transcript_77879:58-690(-)
MRLNLLLLRLLLWRPRLLRGWAGHRNQKRWVHGAIVWHLPACLGRRLGRLVRMVRPNLVAADFRAEPPPAEVRPIAVIPEINHHVEAVDLRIPLVGAPAVVLCTKRIGAAGDVAHRRVRAACDDHVRRTTDCVGALLHLRLLHLRRLHLRRLHRGLLHRLLLHRLLRHLLLVRRHLRVRGPTLLCLRLRLSLRRVPHHDATRLGKMAAEE